MRGFYDELGGPESIASRDEWGSSMTAAGLPASPGVVSGYIYPGHKVTWTPDEGFVESSPSDVPSADTLRHNTLLRRHLANPGYGAVRELSWREKAANGLGVPSVLAAPSPEAMRIVRRRRASPSDM